MLPLCSTHRHEQLNSLTEQWSMRTLRRWLPAPTAVCRGPRAATLPCCRHLCASSTGTCTGRLCSSGQLCSRVGTSSCSCAAGEGGNGGRTCTAGGAVDTTAGSVAWELVAGEHPSSQRTQYNSDVPMSKAEGYLWRSLSSDWRLCSRCADRSNGSVRNKQAATLMQWLRSWTGAGVKQIGSGAHPCPAPVAPAQMDGPFSRMVTSMSGSLRSSARAQARPMMPAPTTATSVLQAAESTSGRSATSEVDTEWHAPTALLRGVCVA